jgi:isopenicillin-N epimerase
MDVRRFWRLDPSVRFLNHGSFGACPIPVLEHQAQLRERMERQPVQFLARDLEPLLDAARGELAAFLGADLHDVVFVPNATTGVNTIVRSLRLGPADEILTTDHAYRACRNAVDFAASWSGADVVVVAVPFPLDHPDRVVERVVEGVTPRTRLAVIDHVTSETGLVLPLERIVRELAACGVDTLVDGAHAAGMLPLDLARLGAAYYTGNCHKWLCAPKGAAFLYVRRDLQPQVRPVVISHGASSTRTDRSRFEIEFGWTGTMDPTGPLSVPAAIRFLEALFPGGFPELRRQNRERALVARDVLCRALAIDRPAPDEMIGSLVAVPLPPSPSTAERSIMELDPLQSELYERYRIETPVFPWPAPPRRTLRVSSQAYNRAEEYELLGDALRQLLALGASA